MPKKREVVIYAILIICLAVETYIIAKEGMGEKKPQSLSQTLKYNHLIVPITLYFNGSQELPPALRDIQLNSTDTYILIIYVDVYEKTGEIVAKEYILFRIEDGELRYIARRLENF